MRFLLAALIFLVACAHPRSSRTPIDASLCAPLICSWTASALYIDPANSSGVAADTNAGTSSGAPLLHFYELLARWGTDSPRIRQTTTITFLSSHTDDTDPVHLKPILEHGAIFYLQGALVQVASITAGTVTARNRATPQLLTVDLGASGAAGQIVVNTSRGSSRAWTITNISGTVWSMTQPMTSVTTLGFGNTIDEVNTWATSDTMTLNTLPNVNITDFEPVLVDYDSSTHQPAYIDLLQIYDPRSGGVDPVVVNNNVNMIDSRSLRPVTIVQAGPQALVAGQYGNMDFAACVNTGQQWIHPSLTMTPMIYGGKIGSTIPASCATKLVGAELDLDVIVNKGSTDYTAVDSGILGLVYLGTGVTLKTTGIVDVSQAPAAEGNIVWGPGTIDAEGASRVKYLSGATGGATAFVLTGGLKLNGQTKSCLTTPGGASSFGTCNVTISAANLDSNLGTTSGCLGTGDGAGFCNFGP